MNVIKNSYGWILYNFNILGAPETVPSDTSKHLVLLEFHPASCYAVKDTRTHHNSKTKLYLKILANLNPRKCGFRYII